MNTSWIELPNNHIDYIKGVIEFIKLAKETLVEGRTRCPCKRCKVDKWLTLDEVEQHILFKGFYKPYKNWIHHRKADAVLRDGSKSTSRGSSSNTPEIACQDDMRALLDATFGSSVSHSVGVHSILRQRGYGSATTTDNSVEIDIMRSKMLEMEKETQELRSKVDQSNARVDQSNQILLQALDAIRTGKVTDKFFESAQIALRVPNSQVGSAVSGNSDRVAQGDPS